MLRLEGDEVTFKTPNLCSKVNTLVSLWLCHDDSICGAVWVSGVQRKTGLANASLRIYSISNLGETFFSSFAPEQPPKKPNFHKIHVIISPKDLSSLKRCLKTRHIKEYLCSPAEFSECVSDREFLLDLLLLLLPQSPPTSPRYRQRFNLE